ncbi:serine/threonine-protein kinase [Nannocystis punicea]|uniref:Serine/threonine-protein kinase n=1 Tax=Nannocystis punicea TaxID=2995304 RepID=A0ABY7GZL2_9BACT|nr:serine/threonine-protein kinase [Nannocystis poenicansa]WAS92342.1 serine/threonine-protein kinase [Nannocystis poenicansa]
MPVQPGIDGDADTLCADVLSAPSRPDPTSEIGGESALSTEAAGELGTRRGRGPVPGDEIGDFTLQRRLGEGGMGVVFAAWSHKLARRVALKIPTRSLDEVVRARIMREAQSLAQVDHPNVVRVYEIGEEGENLFIAMELVEGVTLRKWLSEAPRGWREIVQMYLQAGRGLAAAHHQGLLHRDFKPSNILVDGDGRVRLIDFGLARMRDSSRDIAATFEGDEPSGPEFVLTSRAGTPRYMAPELYDTGATVDARSDQYSFCVALWEALYGELPDWRRTAPHPRAVPGWLLAALRRGLALDREGRFPTMDDLLAELTAGLQPPRRRPLAVVALAAVLGAGVGAALQTAGPASACADPAALADALWPADQRAALRSAGESGMSVETWFSEHVLEYTKARATACRDGARWDEAARARAATCLDERERALRAVAGTLAGAPAGEPTAGAVASGSRNRPGALADPAPGRRWDGRLALWDRALTPASDCVDPRRLAFTVEPPVHIDLSEATWLEEQLQSGAALALAGDPNAAAARLHPARVRAEQAGDRWRQARADLALGIAALDRGDEAGARRRFEAAASDAGAVGDDFLVADAWRWLVFVDAARDPDPEHALLLLPHAESTLYRIGQATGPRMVDLQLSAAWAELRRGDLDAAHARLARALQGGSGVDEALAARVLRHHAEQAHQRGQLRPAVDLARQALSLQLRREGPDSRSVADTRQSLARYQLAVGQYAEAEANLRAALTVAADDPDARERASLELDLAVVHYSRGDLAAARTAAERATTAFAEVADPLAGRADRIALAKLRGDLSLGTDNPAALRSYEAGLALVAAGPDLPETRDNAVAMRVGLAAARQGMGDLAGAADAIERALSQVGGVSPDVAAYAWGTAAELELARNHRREAEAHCRRALALLSDDDAMARELRQLLVRIRASASGRRK